MINGISFDLGKTACGVARWTDGTCIWTKMDSYKDTDTLGQTLLEFKRMALSYTGAPAGGMDWVAYEQRMTGGPRMGLRHLELHYGMVGILHMRAYHLQIPIVSVPISTAKKALSGKGNADKDEMLEAARARVAWKVGTHDEADAIAVGLVALSRMQLPDPQPAPF